MSSIGKTPFGRLLMTLGCLVIFVIPSCGGHGEHSTTSTVQSPVCTQYRAPCFDLVETSPGNCQEFPNYSACAAVPLDGQPALEKQAEFIWTRINGAWPYEYPIQYDRDAQQLVDSKIDRTRVSVLKGSVLTRTGSAPNYTYSNLPGVRVEVVNATGYGQVPTEWGSTNPADPPTGRYFIAVNAGAPIRLRFTKAGYFPVERVVQPEAGEYVSLDPVELLATQAGTSVTPGELKRVDGSPETDGSGARTARVFFPAGTVWHDGSFTGPELQSPLSVSVQEYTVGDAASGRIGDQRMPGDLPATSGYTYAIELRAMDGSTEKHPYFEPPTGESVATYVENFVPLPVGWTVPSGYYDSVKGSWIQAADASGAALNGKIVKITGISGNPPAADVYDGTCTNCNISLAERQQLAAVPYAVNTELWRVPVAHFSEGDFNWSFGLLAGAIGALFSVDTGGTDGSCTTSGSVIECENQALGEEIPLADTPYKLVYRSDRVPGYVAGREARITVPAAGIPDFAKRMLFKAMVAGNEYAEQRDKPGQGWTAQVFNYTWTGTDAFGRTPSGAQPATFKIGLVYDGHYGQTAKFGLPPSADSYSASTTRKEITLWTTWKGTLGNLDAKALGFGGWTLNAQHAYAPASQTVYFGYGGQQRGAVLGQTITKVPSSTLLDPRGLAFGSSGEIYVANSGNIAIDGANPGQVLKIQNGATTTLLGGLLNPTSVAVGPDGSVYVAESGAHRVKRINPDLTVTIIAGHTDGSLGDGSEGCACPGVSPATNCGLHNPVGVAVSPDGNVYIADYWNYKVRRLAPDGTMTTVVNVNKTYGTAGDGGLATLASLGTPVGLALDQTGNLYVVDRAFGLIRRVDPGGRISLFAGGGADGTNDGIAAKQAKLSNPLWLAVAPAGAIYYSEQSSADSKYRFRKITQEGFVITIAGGSSSGQCAGDGGPARNAVFQGPDGVAVGPDNAVYVTDDLCSTSNGVRKIAPPLPGVAIGGTIVPSADGSEFYSFDEVGRHLDTTDAWTGKPRFHFTYTDFGSGQVLTSVNDLRGASDSVGKVTTFFRDASGKLQGLHTVFGQYSYVTLDANGWLSLITTPYGWPTYPGPDPSGSGLLASFLDIDGDNHTFSYDSDGRLTDDRDRRTLTGNPFRHLSRTDDGTTATVSVQTAQGLTTTYADQRLSDGTHQRSVTRPDQSVITAKFGLAGDRTVTLFDGSTRTSTAFADPRFGVAAPTAEETLNLGSKSLIVRVERTPAGPLDPLTFTTLTENRYVKKSTSDAGLKYVQTIVKTGPFVLLSAPSVAASGTHRNVKATLDSYGRVHSITQGDTPEVADVVYEYDGGATGPGRLTRITQGSRRITFEWSASTGFLTAVHRGTTSNENILNTTYFYDSDGRVTQQQTATKTATFAWNGYFLTSVNPTGGSGLWHGLMEEVDANGLPWFRAVHVYNPPDVSGVPSDNVVYAHDTDHRPTATTWPNGSSLAAAYYASGTGTSSGHLQTLTGSGPWSTATFSYDAAARPSTIVTSDGTTTNLGYTGWTKLPDRISTTWPGDTQKDMTWVPDDYLRVGSETVTGGATVNYVYDPDSLVTHACDTALCASPTFNFDLSDRTSQSGRIHSAVINVGTSSMTTTYGYNGTYGDLQSLATTRLGANVYTVAYGLESPNDIGRIGSRSDTVGTGGATSVTYGYDSESRLATATNPTHTYLYDTRGNRTSADGISASYDAQDRILNFGAITYLYDYAGRRTKRTAVNTVLNYSYDAAGNLTQVDYPNSGLSFQYMLDGLGRRVTKTTVTDGEVTAEQRFLYGEGNRIVAELDGTGSVVSRFVYATGRHVPDLMVQGSTVYRILTDHLGSVRLVVNVSTGAIAQRWNYDTWGQATLVSGTYYFQPFGFAGGMYDPDTLLVHFGAREYDPQIGRWITKDPSLFHGGMNLYAYANNDPVNYVDYTGENPLLIVTTAVGAMAGGGLDLAHQLAQNGGNLSCVNGWEVASAAGFGAFAGLTLGMGIGVGLELLGGGEELVTVSRWGRPGLEAGDWVMKGPASYSNYLGSFKWETTPWNQFAPFESGQEFVVPKSTIHWPSGWEFFKGVFGQRIYWP